MHNLKREDLPIAAQYIMFYQHQIESLAQYNVQPQPMCCLALLLHQLGDEVPTVRQIHEDSDTREFEAAMAERPHDAAIRRGKLNILRSRRSSGHGGDHIGCSKEKKAYHHWLAF